MRRAFLAGRASRSPILRPAGCGARPAFAFGLIFGFAVIAEWIVRSTLSRLSLRLPARRRDTRLIRACFALLGLVLDLLPIAVFAGIAYAALSMALDPLTRTRITLSVLVNATVQARLLLCVVRSVLLPADAGHRICTDRRGDPELPLYLGQAVHFLGHFWLRGSEGGLVARRSRSALRVDAEGRRLGTGSPRNHLSVAESGNGRRVDRRRDIQSLRLGPGPPQPRRDLASPRHRLHRRHLPDLRAAHRGRVRLCPARHRAEPHRHRRRAACRALCPGLEPARLCHQTGT